MSVERISNTHQEDQAKPNYLKIIKRTAAALAAVLVIGGLMREGQTEILPTSERHEQDSQRDRNIELKSLKVGDDVQYRDGVYKIDVNKLNLRKDPFVDHEKNNKLTPTWDKDNLYVSGPVYVRSDDNGDWFEAVDANGVEMYFSGSNGGISDVSTGKDVDLEAMGLKNAEVVATTTKGNAAKNEDGENVLIATIENAN
jgi:hypothetical protein